MGLSFGRVLEKKWVAPMYKGEALADLHNGSCSLGTGWGQSIGESLANRGVNNEARIILTHIHLNRLFS